MAGSLLMSVSKDERERAVYRSRRMYQTDVQSNIATAEDRGRREGAFTIVRNLLGMNMSLDQIVTATGLTREETENLDV
jgi:predicted transposase/invertase (TIGR01784 family)